jgi:hypothetical protein
MSSIHYKFRATLEYKTLTFDGRSTFFTFFIGVMIKKISHCKTYNLFPHFAGLHISVDDLKKMICDKENIKTESFDLVLTNTHTKRVYTSEELV